MQGALNPNNETFSSVSTENTSKSTVLINSRPEEEAWECDAPLLFLQDYDHSAFNPALQVGREWALTRFSPVIPAICPLLSPPNHSEGNPAERPGSLRVLPRLVSSQVNKVPKNHDIQHDKKNLSDFTIFFLLLLVIQTEQKPTMPRMSEAVRCALIGCLTF